jgi:hypothetical protein
MHILIYQKMYRSCRFKNRALERVDVAEYNDRAGGFRDGFFLAACFVVTFLLALSPSGADALNIPERLVYDLKWVGIKAGTATLEIVDEEDVIRIISTARSAKWLSVFYTVRDRIESKMARGRSKLFVGLPTNYRVKVREGRHRRDKEVIFDHGNLKAVYKDYRKGTERQISIGSHTFDPLSSFYYIRTLNIEVGKSIYVDIFDSKKMWNVEVQVLRKEKIKTKLGEFNTIVIKPLMKSEGIFSRKGDMYIWLTDDAKRVPVMVKTKVKVGSITATLTGGNY